MFRVLRVTGVHIMEGGMVQPGVRNPGCTTSGLHGHRKWSGVDESGNSLKPAPGATDNTRVQPQVQPPRFHEQDPPSPSRTESPRARRMRARRARHRAYHWAGAVGAGMALVASAVVTVSVFTLHLGVRPVLTGSMRPDYGPGAVLLTRQVPLAAVHPGMIVLFVPPGDHAEYAHRITSVTGPASAPIITTKGDANEVADPWHARLTTPSVSQVVGSVPGIGRLLVGLRGTGQIVVALLGGLVAAWAALRWALTPSSRQPNRRATAGGA